MNTYEHSISLKYSTYVLYSQQLFFLRQYTIPILESYIFEPEQSYEYIKNSEYFQGIMDSFMYHTNMVVEHITFTFVLYLVP
jgi:hypothetical protein